MPDRRRAARAGLEFRSALTCVSLVSTPSSPVWLAARRSRFGSPWVHRPYSSLGGEAPPATEGVFVGAGHTWPLRSVRQVGCSTDNGGRRPPCLCK